jgi:hypothetical protein
MALRFSFSMVMSRPITGRTLPGIGTNSAIHPVSDQGRCCDGIVHPWRLFPRRERSALHTNAGSTWTTQLGSFSMTVLFGGTHPLIRRFMGERFFYYRSEDVNTSVSRSRREYDRGSCCAFL